MSHAQLLSRRALAGFLSAALVILAGCKTIDDDYLDNKMTVSVAEVHENIQKNPSAYLLIDARDTKRFAKEHIPGARRMDSFEIDARDPDPRLNDYKALYVYSDNRGSGDARGLAKKLATAKLSNVYYMAEGIEGWKAAKYPLEQGPDKRAADSSAVRQGSSWSPGTSKSTSSPHY